MRRRWLVHLAAALIAATTTGCVPQSPLAPGVRLCIGMPPEVCQRLLASAQDDEPTLIPTAYRIRCIVALCTAQEGTAEALIVWSDGSTLTAESAWANP